MQRGVRKSEYEAARLHLEGMGVPTTARFMVLATRAVETLRVRRGQDQVIGGSQLASEVAHSATTQAGLRECCRVVIGNDRLRAMRKATARDRPSNPSMEDLAFEIVKYHLHRVCEREIEAIKAREVGAKTPEMARTPEIRSFS